LGGEEEKEEEDNVGGLAGRQVRAGSPRDLRVWVRLICSKIRVMERGGVARECRASVNHPVHILS